MGDGRTRDPERNREPGEPRDAERERYERAERRALKAALSQRKERERELHK